jgi:hypothetical protein
MKDARDQELVLTLPAMMGVKALPLKITVNIMPS